MVRKEDLNKIEKKTLGTLQYLKDQGLSSEEIIHLINKLLKIPISIFKNDSLSDLETIVKYLRENLQLSFKQIASLTNRNEIALAVSYRNSRKKFPSKFTERTSPYDIPILILQDRNLSVLENVVSFLKDKFGLSYHQIAVMLNRNDRTIWTVYQRAKKKRLNG